MLHGNGLSAHRLYLAGGLSRRRCTERERVRFEVGAPALHRTHQDLRLVGMLLANIAALAAHALGFIEADAKASSSIENFTVDEEIERRIAVGLSGGAGDGEACFLQWIGT